MAENSRRIKVTELDFDNIKANLKNYLKGQSQFTDYDFEGAGINTLLDILAYNTHYNALYHNLTVNEMFLDSAQKRSSVVSRALELGYVPRSSRAARASIQITVSNVNGNPNIIEIPKQTPFKTTIDGKNYTFFSTENYVATRGTNNVYVFPNVVLIQGKLLTNTYTVADSAQYIVPNANADMDTLIVSVQEDPNSSARTTYIRGTDISDIKGSTRAYFYKEIENNRFEIYFGDGVLGFKPANGSKVTLEYYTCDQAAPNGARIFTYGGQLFGQATVNILTTTRAEGGGEPESVESIKYNAPRHYAAQGRAVTADDYRTIIPQLYPNVDAISVWGGEENDPPVYGKAFVCIKPKTGATLTAETKNQITTNILKDKNVVSILPEVVDPEYLNIIVDSTVYYNSNSTSKGATTIQTVVADIIQQFNINYLNKFDSVFRHSKLSREIDNSDPAIVSNVTRINLRYAFTPTFNAVTRYRVSLNNPIYTEETGVRNSAISVTSSGFTLSGNTQTWYLEDDAIGNIRMYYITTGNQKVYAPQPVGTVNYAHGTIELNDLSISSGDAQNDNRLVLYIEPASYDVVAVRNQLTNIREQDIVVRAIPDRVASGESSSGRDFIFTPNR